MLVDVSVAFGAAVLTRSTFGGGVVSLVLLFLLDFVGRSEPALALAVRSIHLENLRAIATGDTELLDRVQMTFEADIPPFASVAVVVAYAVVPLGVAVWLHDRRDVDAAGAS